MRQWCLTLFTGYTYRLSLFLKPACRFASACAEYTSAAIRRYGVLHGRKLVTSFPLKCFPFHLVGFGTCEVVGA